RLPVSPAPRVWESRRGVAYLGPGGNRYHSINEGVHDGRDEQHGQPPAEEPGGATRPPGRHPRRPGRRPERCRGRRGQGGRGGGGAVLRSRAARGGPGQRGGGVGGERRRRAAAAGVAGARAGGGAKRRDVLDGLIPGPNSSTCAGPRFTPRSYAWARVSYQIF